MPAPLATPDPLAFAPPSSPTGASTASPNLGVPAPTPIPLAPSAPQPAPMTAPTPGTQYQNTQSFVPGTTNGQTPGVVGSSYVPGSNGGVINEGGGMFAPTPTTEANGGGVVIQTPLTPDQQAASAAHDALWKAQNDPNATPAQEAAAAQANLSATNTLTSDPNAYAPAPTWQDFVNGLGDGTSAATGSTPANPVTPSGDPSNPSPIYTGPGTPAGTAGTAGAATAGGPNVDPGVLGQLGQLLATGPNGSPSPTAPSSQPTDVGGSIASTPPPTLSASPASAALPTDAAGSGVAAPSPIPLAPGAPSTPTAPSAPTAGATPSAPASPTTGNPLPTIPLPTSSASENSATLTPTTPSTALTNDTIAAGPSTDRFGIAQTELNDFINQTNPAYDASLRDANRYAAANGQEGSGILNNSLGDLASQRQQALTSERDNVLGTALNSSIDDAYKNIGIDQQQQQFQAGQQSTAFNQAESTQQLSDAETQQQFSNALQQLLAGMQGDPTQIEQWLAGLFALPQGFTGTAA